MKQRVPLLSFWVFLPLWVIASQAFAAFSISLSPNGARNDVNFGEVEAGDIDHLPTVEVKVDVTNDTGIRYRVTHTMLEPLKNEQGDSFASDQIRFYLRGANRGTMVIQNAVPVQIGTTEMYTSDESGTPPPQGTVILAYTLFVPEQGKGGRYQGRVTINLEPLTASSSAVLQSVTLDISFQVRAVFQLAISSESGNKELDFGKTIPGEPEKSAEISLETSSNLGAEYRLYQSLAEPLVNVETSETIPAEKMTVAFSGGTQGNLSSNALFSKDPVLVYHSDSIGSADRFLGVYRLAGTEALTAGRYEGRLLFTIETTAALPASVPTSYTVPIHLQVDPMFDFVLNPTDGNNLQFKNLNPGDVVEKELVIEIRSNARERYQLQQVISELFSSDSGEVIPEGNLEVLIQDGSKGTPASGNYQTIKMGTTALYTSGNAGDGDTVKLRYRLTVPKEARGGTYHLLLSFTLSAI